MWERMWSSPPLPLNIEQYQQSPLLGSGTSPLTNAAMKSFAYFATR
ncbi:hypothetical protein LCGC14_1849790, partial [marine sediment metagenome]